MFDLYDVTFWSENPAYELIGVSELPRALRFFGAESPKPSLTLIKGSVISEASALDDPRALRGPDDPPLSRVYEQVWLWVNDERTIANVSLVVPPREQESVVGGVLEFLIHFEEPIRFQTVVEAVRSRDLWIPKRVINALVRRYISDVTETRK